MRKIFVIGGGAAGMFAAIAAAEKGNKVYLLEKNDRLGKKLNITGKGRCNVTNLSPVETLLANVVGNPYFLYSAFYTFDSSHTMALFEKMGVPLKVERGNRVFPVSDKASDITRGLMKYLAFLKIEVRLNSCVKEILVDRGKFRGVLMKDGQTFVGDSVIIATGGLSYPATGSTGDGYTFARRLGHHVTKLFPSLVPLKVAEPYISELQGLSLKNVEIDVRIQNKSVYKEFGEMLFTQVGVSGPVILSASRYILGRLGESPIVSIDLKPALHEKDLDRRILRDFEKNLNRAFKNSLDELLPKKLIPVMVRLSEIPPELRVNEITKEQRKRLLGLFKRLSFTVVDTTGFGEAVVTSGGVTVDEVDPSTMQSKLVAGVFFAGEVLDVDAFTGGFNLQIAFATGYIAGSHA